MRGLVIRTQSGFYTVETATRAFACQLRGRLKKGARRGDVLAVGDWVEFTPLEANTGVIEQIEPRQRLISRLSPDPKGLYEQILIANPDQIALVFACTEPDPRFGMLDRFLVMAEKGQVPACIVANKTDLVQAGQANALFSRYARLDYPIYFTSVQDGSGVEELRAALRDKITLFTGPSGVGKSSLLNAIQPGLGLQVRQINRATGKGRHTTVVRELYPLQGGGYVADTPGLKALALWDIEGEELDAYFRELRDLVPECQFSDCTHVHEPGCAVLEAVEAGQIHPERYQSYLRLRYGEQE